MTFVVLDDRNDPLDLYVTQILCQAAGDYGLLLAFGALGGVAASVASGGLARRMGVQRLLIGTVVIMAATQLVLGLTADVVVAAGMLATSSAASAVFNVTAVGMHQRRVPVRLLARVNSAYLAVGGGPRHSVPSSAGRWPARPASEHECSALSLSS